VDLEDGVRVFGRILVADGTEPKVGDSVTLTTTEYRTDDEGRPVRGHAFTAS
jgi:hypothetical protein